MTSFSFLTEDDLYGSAATEQVTSSKGSDARMPKFAPKQESSPQPAAAAQAAAPAAQSPSPGPPPVSRKDLEVLASYVEFLERRLTSLERSQAQAAVVPPQPTLTPWMLVFLLSIALVVLWLRRAPPVPMQVPAGPYYVPFASPAQAPGTPGLAMPPVTFLPR